MTDTEKTPVWSRYLECTGEKTRRFWMVEIKGTNFLARHGALGKAGTSYSKTFESHAAAIKNAEKMIRAKLKQGFEEEAATRYTDALAKSAATGQTGPPRTPGVVLRAFHEGRFLHRGDTDGVAFTRDGARLICAASGSLAVWDVASGELRGQGTYSSRVSGAQVVMSCDDDSFALHPRWGGPLLLFNDACQLLAEVPFRGSYSSARSHVSKAGVWLVVGSELQRWDAASQDFEFPIDLPNAVDEQPDVAAFSQDGSRLAYTRSGSGLVTVVETRTGKMIAELEGKVGNKGLAISPDGLRVATHQRGEDGLKIWDIEKAEATQQHGEYDWQAYAQSLTFSPDGARVLMVSSGPKELCVDVATGAALWQRTPVVDGKAHAFSPDGARIAVAINQRVQFLGTEDGVEEQGESKGPDRPFEQLWYDERGEQLFGFTSGTGENLVFDAATLQIVGSFPGRGMACSVEEEAALIGTQRGLSLLRFENRGIEDVLPTTPMIWGLGPRHIATVVRENYDAKFLKLWTRHGHSLGTLMEDRRRCPNSALGFSPDGRWLFGGRSKVLIAWDLETRDELWERTEHSSSIAWIVASADGRWLATGDKHRSLIVWSLPEGEVKHRFKLESTCIGVQFSPNSRQLITFDNRGAQSLELETMAWRVGISWPKHATAAALTRSGVAHIATQDCSVMSIDARELVDPSPASPARQSFLDWTALLGEATELDALAAAIEGADWSAFDAHVDTAPLRRALTRIEAAQGVTTLHHECSHQVLTRDRRLLHRFGHRSPPIDSATSPCGRWLATGSWVGEMYEAGGEVQIWERETGRCVNTLLGIDGGVGWPDYSCMEWSPDATKLGMIYSTNAVGDFLPFGSVSIPMSCIDVTNGGNRPPGWTWTPDGRAVVVYYGQCCVAVMDRAVRRDRDVMWHEGDEPPEEVMASYGEPVKLLRDASFDFDPVQIDPGAWFELPKGMTVPRVSDSPLVAQGRNLGRHFAIDPAFPIRDDRRWRWAVAFESGLVVCPPELQSQIDDEVSFAVLNRWSWPFRWADKRHAGVVGDLTEAADHPLLPFDASYAQSVREAGLSQRVAREVFEDMTLDDLRGTFSDSTFEGIAQQTFQINALEVGAYQCDAPLEGDAINTESLRGLLGKVVLYAERYRPEEVKAGALLNINEKRACLYHRSVSGGSQGFGWSEFTDLVFIGEAKDAYGSEDAGEDAGEALRAARRASLPSGENLAQRSDPSGDREQLILPLPFDEGHALVLEWERIEGFDVSESTAWAWGVRLRDTKQGCHFLGRFLYDGEPLQAVEGPDGGVERFVRCRCDSHGSEYEPREAETFNAAGDGRFNATLLMRCVPKRGQFNATQPIDEILMIRFGRVGHYQLEWQFEGEDRWRLEVDDEKLFKSEDYSARHRERFVFDFAAKTVSWTHHYRPQDHWKK